MRETLTSTSSNEGWEQADVCPLCTGSAHIKWQAHGRHFYHCERCDLVFVPKAQHLSPADEQAQYRLHDNTTRNAGYVKMFTDTFAALKAHWHGVTTVLDYGCGPGPVLVELLNREGYRAVGYDPYFAPDTPLDCTYNAVISTETFEHFASPARELGRIDGLLSAGGYLAVMTRFRTPEISVPEWWYVREPTHITFYSPATFGWIARAFGYEIVYSDDERFIIFKKAAEIRT